MTSFGGGSALGATGGAILVERGGGTGPHPPGQQNGHFQTPVYKKVSDRDVRPDTSCILRDVSKLGLDTALFLTDSSFLKLNGLPPFYQGVFKSWAIFNHKTCEHFNSLHWLLKEPLIHGSRLDICSVTPGAADNTV